MDGNYCREPDVPFGNFQDPLLLVLDMEPSSPPIATGLQHWSQNIQMDCVPGRHLLACHDGWRRLLLGFLRYAPSGVSRDVVVGGALSLLGKVPGENGQVQASGFLSDTRGLREIAF